MCCEGSMGNKKCHFAQQTGIFLDGWHCPSVWAAEEEFVQPCSPGYAVTESAGHDKGQEPLAALWPLTTHKSEGSASVRV